MSQIKEENQKNDFNVISQKIDEAVLAIEKIELETINSLNDFKLKKLSNLKGADVEAAFSKMDEIRKKIDSNLSN
jgi:hypothetical protein